MPRSMPRSYAFRLAAAFAGIGIAAAALTAILVNLAFGSRFSSYLETQQSVQQRQLVASITDAYERAGQWDPARLQAVGQVALMSGGTLQVMDSTGSIVWASSLGMYSGPMEAMHRQMMGGGPLGPEHRLPIVVNGSDVGTAVVRLPEPGLLPHDVAFRNSINRLLLIGGVVAGLLALALGLLLARRATAPARELTKAARALAAGDHSHRVALDTPDEFGEMAAAFNRMADGIEEEDRLRRAFAGDVAHEVRTPLAILRSQVEGMQDGVVKPTPSALASLHEEVLRLTRLVVDLEALGAADAAEFSLRREPVALRSLLEESIREFAGPFEAQAVALETDLEDSIVNADPARVRQIVANLLSNALKFTAEGGRVRVELRPDGPVAVIRVTDTGPGIPADELAHVFDRFFRGRGARTGGSGIGLTIARDLARAHGGELDVKSENGQGTTSTLRLPLLSPPPRAIFTPPSHARPTLGAKGERT